MTDKKSCAPAPPVLDLGTWSQYTTVPRHEENADSPAAAIGAVGEITRPESRCCAHCGRAFTPRRAHHRYCKPGCRTYAHRLKRQALITGVWEAFGLPYEKALDVVDVHGIQRVSKTLIDAGYVWDGKWWIKNDD